VVVVSLFDAAQHQRWHQCEPYPEQEPEYEQPRPNQQQAQRHEQELSVEVAVVFSVGLPTLYIRRELEPGDGWTEEV